MELGIHFSNFSLPEQLAITPTLTRTAQVADQGGVELFTVMDHYFQMEMRGGPPEPMLEGYTTLGYLAGVTERIRLGLLVTGVTYRHPGLLAKIVTTLDVLSEGRAQLGIGAAWYDREHAGLGVPFPPVSERFERLEEALQICRQMWGADEGPYTGRHYQLAETVCVPPPVQAGGPPVMIGGSGERKTLRLVAQYADACNLFGTEPAELAHKVDVLRRHCDDVGRDFDTVRKTALCSVDPLTDLDGFLTRIQEYADLGVSLVTMSPLAADPLAWTTEVVEKVLPRMQQM